MSAQSATGADIPEPRQRRVEGDEWAELLGDRKIPEGGRRVPSNIMKRPVNLPPMRRIKDR